MAEGKMEQDKNGIKIKMSIREDEMRDEIMKWCQQKRILFRLKQTEREKV